MNKKSWLIIITLLFATVSFSISAKSGCVNPFNTHESGSSARTSAQATSPNPSNGATNVAITTTLTWASAVSATSYDVYFGITTTDWTSVTNTILTSYALSPLLYATTYYWRIDSKNSAGTTTGNVWSFTTQPLQPPAQVTLPNPANEVTGTYITIQLSWASANGATSYDVYFINGWTPVTNTTNTTYNTGMLSYNTTYYWRVDSKNSNGTTTGPVWSFTTALTAPPAVDDYIWVANYFSNNVTRILKSNPTITTTITVGTAPIGVAVDETYCWVANYHSNNVTRILKLDTTQKTTITMGSSPWGVAVDETYCWITNQEPSNVTRIKKSDLSTTTIAGGSSPKGVAVDGTYCWVTNNNKVTRIVKSTLATTTIAVGSYPFGVAVDETYCWVANNGDGSGNTVTRIMKSDLSTTTIGVGTGPFGVAVDETYCWVANNNSNNVTRISKSDLSTTTIVVGTDPYGVAVDGTYCWVANYGSNNVTRILKSDLTTTTIAVGSYPYSLGDMTGYAYDNYSRVP